MAWKREGGATDKIKVSFEINRSKMPELAEWFWGLPYGKASSHILAILENHVKNGGESRLPSNTKPERVAVAQTTPRKDATTHVEQEEAVLTENGLDVAQRLKGMFYQGDDE